LEYLIATRKGQLKAPGAIIAASGIVEFGGNECGVWEERGCVKCDLDYERD
jgi:hypothetical protein